MSRWLPTIPSGKGPGDRRSNSEPVRVVTLTKGRPMARHRHRRQASWAVIRPARHRETLDSRPRGSVKQARLSIQLAQRILHLSAHAHGTCVRGVESTVSGPRGREVASTYDAVPHTNAPRDGRRIRAGGWRRGLSDLRVQLWASVVACRCVGAESGPRPTSHRSSTAVLRLLLLDRSSSLDASHIATRHCMKISAHLSPLPCAATNTRRSQGLRAPHNPGRASFRRLA